MSTTHMEKFQTVNNGRWTITPVKSGKRTTAHILRNLFRRARGSVWLMIESSLLSGSFVRLLQPTGTCHSTRINHKTLKHIQCRSHKTVDECVIYNKSMNKLTSSSDLRIFLMMLFSNFSQDFPALTLLDLCVTVLRCLQRNAEQLSLRMNIVQQHFMTLLNSNI